MNHLNGLNKYLSWPTVILSVRIKDSIYKLSAKVQPGLNAIKVPGFLALHFLFSPKIMYFRFFENIIQHRSGCLQWPGKSYSKKTLFLSSFSWLNMSVDPYKVNCKKLILSVWKQSCTNHKKIYRLTMVRSACIFTYY